MENEGTEGQRGEPAASIDDIFDYDFGLDEILQDAPAVSNKNAAGPSAPDASGLGLGVDEEVKVTKKRQPVAKLDESRLLSQPGIPKLRRTAKQKLHFKGKGHEFSDAARLLNFYQLWLDDLFPRAKFVDGLAMIEKLGHSKRLQTMRREWIEQEKPKPQTDDLRNALQANQTTQNPSDKPENPDPTSTEQFQTDKTTRDEMQGSSANRSTWPQSSRRPNDTDQSLFMSDDEVGHHTNEQDAPDDDELDALLREQEDEVPATKNAPIVTGFKLPDFGYDDELEAMMELDALDPIAT